MAKLIFDVVVGRFRRLATLILALLSVISVVHEHGGLVQCQVFFFENWDEFNTNNNQMLSNYNSTINYHNWTAPGPVDIFPAALQLIAFSKPPNTLTSGFFTIPANAGLTLDFQIETWPWAPATDYAYFDLLDSSGGTFFSTGPLYQSAGCTANNTIFHYQFQ